MQEKILIVRSNDGEHTQLHLIGDGEAEVCLSNDEVFTLYEELSEYVQDSSVRHKIIPITHKS